MNNFFFIFRPYLNFLKKLTFLQLSRALTLLGPIPKACHSYGANITLTECNLTEPKTNMKSKIFKKMLFIRIRYAGNPENLNEDQLCINFPFLRNNPKFFSIKMQHLRSITEKDV